MKVKYISLFVSFSLLAACVKDRPNPDSHALPASLLNSVLVLNEGSYGNNNADISLIDLQNKKVSNAIFSSVNAQSLGDVAQSISLINGKYYLAVNNSHKIVVLDTADFHLMQTIDQIRFPRYITQVSADIAFVSSLYTAHLYVLQLSAGLVIDTLYTDFPNTEKMWVQGDDVWVSNWDTACHDLYRFDRHTWQLKSKVPFNNTAAFDMVEDKDQRLWILSGNTYKNKSACLTRINTQTRLVEQTLYFDAKDDPIRLTMNSTKDTLYFINVNYNGSSHNGVYRLSIYTNTLPSTPWITAPANTYFWAMGFNPRDGHLFLSDPKGFTQSSTVYEYTADAVLLRSYATGIGSNQFLFR